MTGARAAVLVVAKVLVTDTAAVKEKSPHLSPRCGQDLRKDPLPRAQIWKPWFVSKSSSGLGSRPVSVSFTTSAWGSCWQSHHLIRRGSSGLADVNQAQAPEH